ncbi:MAG: hypothetical protein LBJ93_02610 [Clostridiales bacterium]|jgi:hypothetical protein|nr:hypothetical protein [Clostridiales bacterium]
MNLNTKKQIEAVVNEIYNCKIEQIKKILTSDRIIARTKEDEITIELGTQETVKKAVLIMFELVDNDGTDARIYSKLFKLSAIFVYLFDYIISTARQKQQDGYYSDSNVKYIRSLLRFLKSKNNYFSMLLYIHYYKLQVHDILPKRKEKRFDFFCYLTLEGYEEENWRSENVTEIIDILVKDNNFEQVKKIRIKDNTPQSVSSLTTNFSEDPIDPIKRDTFIAISSPLIGSSVTVILLGLFNHLFTDFAINLIAIDMLKFLPAAFGLVLCVIFVIKLMINKFRNRNKDNQNLPVSGFFD